MRYSYGQQILCDFCKYVKMADQAVTGAVLPGMRRDGGKIAGAAPPGMRPATGPRIGAQKFEPDPDQLAASAYPDIDAAM